MSQSLRGAPSGVRPGPRAPCNGHTSGGTLRLAAKQMMMKALVPKASLLKPVSRDKKAGFP